MSLIADVLMHYGADPISDRRSWQAIHCPFHDDSQQSASVNTGTGFFKCHAGCKIPKVNGRRGAVDAYDLVAWMENLNGAWADTKRRTEELSVGGSSPIPKRAKGRTRRSEDVSARHAETKRGNRRRVQPGVRRKSSRRP